MTYSGKDRRGGISIRVLHFLMIVCAAAVALLLLFSSYQSMEAFSTLSQETGNYIVRQKAAHDLMEASDYLTEMVQRFTINGDTTYLNNYFEEALVSKRREASILSMSENSAEQNLVAELTEALNESNSLMYREYYAMKLVVEAKEIQEYPDTLKAIELNEEDSFLSLEAKMSLAQDMVMGVEYYESKDLIRTRLKNSLETMDNMMAKTRQETNAEMMQQLSSQRIVVISLVAVLVLLVLLITLLAVRPLVAASRSIQNKKPLQVIGASEFRALAEDYNGMYLALGKGEEEEGSHE